MPRTYPPKLHRVGAYRKGCKCPSCREAVRDYKRRWRAARRKGSL